MARNKRRLVREILQVAVIIFIGGIMTEIEKQLLQAKHRLEEAEARDRVKERKARTRRLIQEGAILEKVFPTAKDMSLEELQEYLRQRFG